MNRRFFKGLTGFWLCMGLFFVLFTLWDAAGAFAQDVAPLGEAARQRAAEEALKPHETSWFDTDELVWGIQIFTGLLIALAMALILQGSRLTGFDPFAKWDRNKWMAVSWVIVPIVLAVLFVIHMVVHTKHLEYFLQDSASDHGKLVDTMLWTTLWITGIVFVLIHIILVVFAYKYRGREGNKAYFYPENHTLELWLTIIPGIVLSGLCIGGIRAWNIMHAQPKDDFTEIELVAQQFQWTVRYPGADKALGDKDFRLISGSNVLGIDFRDPKSLDDIIPAQKEIHVPVGSTVKVNIRSKDVLHGVFFPHFRVQIYAVPGMPTELTFKPIKTTAQRRIELNNPDFNFELACSQLCGAAHYNMRMIVIVHEQKEYDEWLKSQKSFISNDNKDKMMDDVKFQVIKHKLPDHTPKKSKATAGL